MRWGFNFSVAVFSLVATTFLLLSLFTRTFWNHHIGWNLLPAQVLLMCAFYRLHWRFVDMAYGIDWYRTNNWVRAIKRR